MTAAAKPAWQDALYDLLRVKPTDPPSYKRDLDPAACRDRFRAALPVLS